MTTSDHPLERTNRMNSRGSGNARLLSLASIALMVTGGVGAIVLPVIHDSVQTALVVFIACLTVAVLGAVGWTYVSIRYHGRSIDEAYRLGFDLGYEIGWREHEAMKAEGEEAAVGPPPWPSTRRNRRRYQAAQERQVNN